MGVNTDQTAVGLQNKLKPLSKIAITDAVQEKRHPSSVGQNPRDPQYLYGMLATRRPFAALPHSPATVRVAAVSADLNTYVSEPRAMEASLVRDIDDAEKWILVEVVQYSASSECEVDDIDEQQKDRHVLSRRRIYKAIINKLLAPATDDYEVLLERIRKGE
jgi:hypothetical protein